MNLHGWQPTEDQVFIQRLEPIEQERGSKIVLTDIPQQGKMILRKGKVLAVGPGKWIEGTWWFGIAHRHSVECVRLNCQRLTRDWYWIPGYRETLEVKPGMTVIFNARWNDLAHAENRGSGADGSGPMERPLSYKFDPSIHLVQEADIAGILA